MREVVLLGATGSIGTQALDVVARNGDAFRVVGLAAGGTRPELLASQVLDTGAEVVAVGRREAADELGEALRAEGVRRGLRPGDRPTPKIFAGPDAATELAGWPCDVVLNGIDGAAGLRPTLAALEAGRTLALANKESLIVGGPLVKARARDSQIVPVDSEHSALAQCLRAGHRDEVRRLVLTASGGPFRGRSAAELADVAPEEALAHPTWDMGPLVTVNSATLVNKGLETIEAHLLFDVDFDAIEVVVHPQSIVHSMVTFADGATIAQASPPDMRLPIALALAWPGRVAGAAPALDWTHAQSWEFLPLDREAFPAVDLARDCGEAGGVLPAAYNAANEVAVGAFLGGRLPFPGIVDTIAVVVAEVRASSAVPPHPLSLDDVLGADGWARERAAHLIAERAG